MHEGAADSAVTFAAPETSNVAGTDLLTGPSARTYTWNAGTKLWYPSR